MSSSDAFNDSPLEAGASGPAPAAAPVAAPAPATRPAEPASGPAAEAAAQPRAVATETASVDSTAGDADTGGAAPSDAVAGDNAPGEGAPGDARRPRNRRGRGGRGRGAPDGARAEGGSGGNVPAAGRRAPQAPRAAQAPKAERQVHPLLEKLAALYPQLFGARFLPLQRGVYEALLARHPEELPDAELKVALGLHARSGRYLEAIAQRLPRHSLDGEVVEPVAPEHVHHAIVELYRRRQGRTQEDLRPKLIARLVEAIDASGLDRTAYTEQARVVKPEALALIDEAFAEHGRVTARREALQRAFAASGQTDVDAFADMYGIPLGEARRYLKRASQPAAAPAQGD